ncbi:MAG: hypothetical protein P4L45_00740 [Ignavibacteriaceae bacterium]|nr:hypothetical protein [Ignavibacteriaceae bacterium]
MVNPVQSLVVNPNPFGSQLDIIWVLPTDLPDNYKVYLFQKGGQDIQQQQIDDYFNAINTNADLKTFPYNDLYVFDYLHSNWTAYSIYEVANGLTYYYKIVIRDEESGDYSTAVSANGIPDSQILVNSSEPKDLICKVLTKTLNTIKDKSGKRLQLDKDINIVKQFTIGEPESDQLMIEIVNGSQYQKYWGNIFHQNANEIYFGDMDSAILRVTFLTIAGPQRRDDIQTIMRGRKFLMYRLTRGLGAVNTEITFEGDYFNPSFHGDRAVGFTIIFNLIIENSVKITLDEVDQIVSEIKVENNG